PSEEITYNAETAEPAEKNAQCFSACSASSAFNVVFLHKLFGPCRFDRVRRRVPVREHTARASAKRLALVGGMLLTGYEVPPIHHAAILIEGDRIVAAGPSSDVRIPA